MKIDAFNENSEIHETLSEKRLCNITVQLTFDSVHLWMPRTFTAHTEVPQTDMIHEIWGGYD